MFSSKPPRENNDPYPNVWHGHSPYNQMRGDTDMFREGAPYHFERYIYRPRPEFDHVQHNAPNPILVEFRDNVARRGEDPYWGDTWDSTMDWLDQAQQSDTSCIEMGVTTAHINHAQRVLKRLANMKEEI